MSRPAVPEAVVNLVEALIENQALRSWFFAVGDLPSSVRNAAFAGMAAQMRKAGEDAALIDAIAGLARPKMYEIVLTVVRERCG